MNQKKKKLDKILLLFLLIFMAISLITIYSASTYLSDYLGNLPFKQFIWYFIGFLFLIFITRTGNTKILKLAWLFYGLGVLLLLLLFPFGTSVNNSKCWFTIPGIGSFQPSEFMKIALILVLAKETDKFHKKKQNPTILEECFFLIKVFIIVFVPSILTFLQPDTGAVLIYFVITIFILFLSGIRKSWFLLAILLVISLGSLFFFLYFQKRQLFIQLFGTNLFYRIDRLLDWKVGSGFQLENALTAIGSSGLIGHGFNHTPIYFPESGTDFIFAVFSSNFGLIGSILFLLILLVFDCYLLYLTYHNPNPINQYLIIGVLGILVYQQIQNIGMTIGLLPIMGITLPFISYGGSSLLSYFILMGLIFNIQKEQKKGP